MTPSSFVAFHYMVEVMRNDVQQAQLVCVVPIFSLSSEVCERRNRAPLTFVETEPGLWRAQGQEAVFQIRLLVARAEPREVDDEGRDQQRHQVGLAQYLDLSPRLNRE